MQISMTGRTALITGGSDGMGRAMALKFAGAGASVAIAARRQGPLDEALAAIEAMAPGRAAAFSADVGTAADCERIYRDTVARFGAVDILVNNAGTSQTGKFEEIDDATWQADLDLKLFAAIRLSRLALPDMKARGWGRIVNVLNVGAKAPQAGSAPTAVSRAAGMALTKVLAGEGAPHGVLVNALLTGYIRSGQWVRRHADAAPDADFDTWLGDMAGKLGVPLGRFGEAEEFANIACFLASDAGSYITGTAINVDGNRSPVV